MKEAEMTFENVKLMLHGVLDLESLRFITSKLDGVLLGWRQLLASCSIASDKEAHFNAFPGGQEVLRNLRSMRAIVESFKADERLRPNLEKHRDLEHLIEQMHSSETPSELKEAFHDYSDFASSRNPSAEMRETLNMMGSIIDDLDE